MTDLVVWVVDDDPDVADHLQLVCEQAGYGCEMHLFESASSLRAALGSDDAPDLVLIDQILPDGRGTDLLTPTRWAYPGAVVRLITAAPDETDDVDRALGVVSKPPTVDVIRALMQHGAG